MSGALCAWAWGQLALGYRLSNVARRIGVEPVELDLSIWRWRAATVRRKPVPRYAQVD